MSPEGQGRESVIDPHQATFPHRSASGLSRKRSLDAQPAYRELGITHRACPMARALVSPLYPALPFRAPLASKGRSFPEARRQVFLACRGAAAGGLGCGRGLAKETTARVFPSGRLYAPSGLEHLGLLLPLIGADEVAEPGAALADDVEGDDVHAHALGLGMPREPQQGELAAPGLFGLVDGQGSVLKVGVSGAFAREPACY
jgi:hypothetical protein